VAHELAQLPPEAMRDTFTGNNSLSDGLIFPVARIRKICKLDDEVHGVSKEAAVLLTKCVELVTIRLGQECVKVARMQNRRKLLPDDLAQVCSTREQFHFLREDVKDLLREQKSGPNDPPKQASIVATPSTKPLTAFFPTK
jgi:histone H3/H4